MRRSRWPRSGAPSDGSVSQDCCFSGLGMGALAASMQGVSLFSLESQPLGSRPRDRRRVGLDGADRRPAGRAGRSPVDDAMAVHCHRHSRGRGLVAVATLVWSGHAGVTEGAAGTVHRISDILHMIAAAVWIGAIGAFLWLTAPKRIRESPDGPQIRGWRARWCRAWSRCARKCWSR